MEMEEIVQLTALVEDKKQQIVRLRLQQDRDEALVQELRNEQALLSKEQSTLAAALACVVRDAEAVAAAERGVAAGITAREETLKGLAGGGGGEGEYELLRRRLDPERMRLGLPPLSRVQDDIDAAMSQRLADKRVLGRAVSETVVPSPTLGSQSRSGQDSRIDGMSSCSDADEYDAEGSARKKTHKLRGDADDGDYSTRSSAAASPALKRRKKKSQ
ncbi:hypothetical protein HDU80_001342 [Chytriomyces hyalinus]|nr:hypothetical protein HDU80_001342 [Chytriomyces hyalinus]